MTIQQEYEAATRLYSSLPHQDSRVLHSRGACILCDSLYSRLQQLRVKLGIPFTDELGQHQALLPWDSTRNRLISDKCFINRAWPV